MDLLKLRAVPFIETSGTEEAKKLLSTPFTFSMLINSFDDWSFKDKGTYSNYINKTDSRIVIECYPIGYSLNNGKFDLSIENINKSPIFKSSIDLIFWFLS